MSSYMTETLERIVAIQIDAVKSVCVADSVPFGAYSQRNFPYFKNRWMGTQYEDQSMDFQMRTITVGMRLVVGHFTSIYDGAWERLLYELVPLVESAFSTNHWLQLANEGAVRGMSADPASFQPSPCFLFYQVPKMQGFEVGIEWLMDIQFHISNQRKY